MTLEQKIGAMLMLGWEGENPTDDTTVCAKAREIVEEMQVGGVILMGRNIRHDDLSVTVNTINELQSLAAEPLLVNVDQEGGMVARFTDGVTVMPSNMALGATRRPDLAYKAAAACAEELKAAYKAIDKAAKNGVIHKDCAYRKKARMMRRINAAQG